MTAPIDTTIGTLAAFYGVPLDGSRSSSGLRESDAGEPVQLTRCTDVFCRERYDHWHVYAPGYDLADSDWAPQGELTVGRLMKYVADVAETEATDHARS